MTKIKLNLGSGPSGINGWLNYDSGVLPWLSRHSQLRRLVCFLGLLPKSYDVIWPETQLVDIRNRFPLDDNSTDNIYCSQVLEHFELYQAQEILREAHRVLKPGGLIRVSVPDIKKMFSLDITPREINVLWWGYEKDIPPTNFFVKISRLFIRDHQWHYDETSMKQLLSDSGFKNIEILSFRKGKTPDLARVEIGIHRKHSLYIESQK